MTSGAPKRGSSTGGGCGCAALLLLVVVVSLCSDDDSGPAAGEAAADPDSAAAVPARVDTILNDGRTVVTSDGWTRSDGLEFRTENGVLHIDSGSLGGPLPPAATPPPTAAPDPETVAPPDFLPADRALWVPVGRWRGNDETETPRFRVGTDEWRMVLTVGEPPPGVHRSVQVRAVTFGNRTVAEMGLLGPAADTGYVHAAAGLYHLRVRSLGAPWTLVAEEKRVPAEALPARP
ncbi:MAG TPA: hypothetical protein VHG91_12385 [Longimicrobium sp.]|nr:hypothetical protein [Longimicrobium sp.]